MFNFRDLNLKNVQASSGAAVLPEGKYVCKITDAKVDKTRNNGVQVILKLTDVGGAGSINEWLTIYNPNSEESQRINRERLKAVLVHGGHRDPDNIGAHGIESIRGLTVGVAVRNEEYTDRNGQKRIGPSVHYFFDPKEIGFEGGSIPQPAGGGSGFDDFPSDIPY
jgi:hypothetical protein